MASFSSLPLELLEQIIFLLTDEKPPSANFLHEEPSDALLKSGHHPLKDLSRACRSIRRLCFSTLFSTLKVNFEHVVDFSRFSENHGLSGRVDSLVLYLDPTPQAEKPSNCNIWLSMVQVLDSIKPSALTLLLPPSFFQQILPYDLDLTNQWAFCIPCQVLQLRMPPDLAASSQVPQRSMLSRNVFQLREWTHCTFNQGSSINGYSTYEYFFKRSPSIFNPRLRHELRTQMAEGSFQNMTSLDYVAILPIDHTDLFCLYLTFMKKLKTLRVQFAPTARNDVLDNPAALGKCQPGDLWQEFEACYITATQYISSPYTGISSLEEFISLDYANPSLRELLDRAVGQNLANWGSDMNDGRWIRNEANPEEFDQ